jgi:hypothetical protein
MMDLTSSETQLDSPRTSASFALAEETKEHLLPLSALEPDSNLRVHSLSRNLEIRKLCATIWTLLLTFLFLTTLFTLIIRSSTDPKWLTRDTCSCGSSLSEAKSLGCKYDTLAAC